MADPYRLERFVAAQQGVYPKALAELLRGAKQSHWMWFVFPQLAGLGRSPMARRYAIAGREEGLAYLAHPVLGPRLEECTAAMLTHAERSAESILGSIDAMKLRSSMTLFAELAGPESLYSDCLRSFFNGEPDRQTLRLLAAAASVG